MSCGIAAENMQSFTYKLKIKSCDLINSIRMARPKSVIVFSVQRLFVMQTLVKRAEHR